MNMNKKMNVEKKINMAIVTGIDIFLLEVQHCLLSFVVQHRLHTTRPDSGFKPGI
jgi:hypothetical protein